VWFGTTDLNNFPFAAPAIDDSQKRSFWLLLGQVLILSGILNMPLAQIVPVRFKAGGAKYKDGEGKASPPYLLPPPPFF